MRADYPGPLAISPDRASRVAEGETVQLWDATSRELIAELPWVSEGLMSVHAHDRIYLERRILDHLEPLEI